MTKWYRHRNKRMVPRGRGGRFRTTTLADVGMACCEDCKKIFRPDFSKAESGGMVDPRIMRDLRKQCPECAKGDGTSEESD
jgi:hypothetical protein